MVLEARTRGAGQTGRTTAVRRASCAGNQGLRGKKGPLGGGGPAASADGVQPTWKVGCWGSDWGLGLGKWAPMPVLPTCTVCMAMHTVHTVAMHTRSSPPSCPFDEKARHQGRSFASLFPPTATCCTAHHDVAGRLLLRGEKGRGPQVEPHLFWPLTGLPGLTSLLPSRPTLQAQAPMSGPSLLEPTADRQAALWLNPTSTL